jgi:hypothetical protein
MMRNVISPEENLFIAICVHAETSLQHAPGFVVNITCWQNESLPLFNQEAQKHALQNAASLVELQHCTS